jgi:hypothetical protein
MPKAQVAHHTQQARLDCRPRAGPRQSRAVECDLYWVLQLYESCETLQIPKSARQLDQKSLPQSVLFRLALYQSVRKSQCP